MNKEELEKIFDEKFDINSEGTSFGIEYYTNFIFETIIPEVLKSIITEEYFKYDDYFNAGYNRATEDIKQKAKELYNINL